MKTFSKIYILLIFIIALFPVILKNTNINYQIARQKNPSLPINNEIKQSEIYIEPEIKQLDTSLMFFGDIMTGRNVEELSKDNNNYPFLKLQDLLNEKNDIRIANLEGPINKNHKQVPTGSMSFSLPEYTASILKQNGFNLMQLANNHMQDRDSNGFIETQTILKDNNIDFFGDYYNINEYISFEKNINNIPFLFIGINMINTDCEKETNLCITNIENEVKNTINKKNNWTAMPDLQRFCFFNVIKSKRIESEQKKTKNTKYVFPRKIKKEKLTDAAYAQKRYAEGMKSLEFPHSFACSG